MGQIINKNATLIISCWFLFKIWNFYFSWYLLLMISFQWNETFLMEFCLLCNAWNRARFCHLSNTWINVGNSRSNGVKWWTPLLHTPNAKVNIWLDCQRNCQRNNSSLFWGSPNWGSIFNFTKKLLLLKWWIFAINNYLWSAIAW